MADQRATRGSDSRTNDCSTRMTSGEAADERACTGAGRGSLASWRIARVQTECGEQNATNNCEKLFVHNDSSLAH